MQNCFQEVPLTRVLRIEELEQLKHELLIDDPLANTRLEIGALQETQKELVDQLQVGPAGLQCRVVLLRIEVGVLAGRQRPKQVVRYHLDDFGIHRLCEDAPSARYVIDQLVQRATLDLLPLEIGHGVHEVEGHAALPQLSDEQLLLLGGGDICGRQKPESVSSTSTQAFKTQHQ